MRMTQQQSLFRTRRSWRHPWQSSVAALLHYANSSPPIWRHDFTA